MRDGNTHSDLATFGGTCTDDYVNRLYLESADKNMIDKDESPRTLGTFLGGVCFFFGALPLIPESRSARAATNA